MLHTYAVLVDLSTNKRLCSRSKAQSDVRLPFRFGGEGGGPQITAWTVQFRGVKCTTNTKQSRL